jgi:hypothetical protein
MSTDAPSPEPPAVAGYGFGAHVLAMLGLVMSIALSNLGQWSTSGGGRSFEAVQWITFGGAVLGVLTIVVYLTVWVLSPSIRQREAAAWIAKGRMPWAIFGGILLASAPIHWIQMLIAGGNVPAQISFACAGIAALSGGLLLRALRPAKPDVAA